PATFARLFLPIPRRVCYRSNGERSGQPPGYAPALRLGEYMISIERSNLCRAVVGTLLIFVARPAFAQIQVPKCEIRLDEGGRLNNASQSDAGLSATAADGRLVLGRRVFFADGTSVSGAFVGLGNSASIFNVNVDVLDLGRRAEVRGAQGPFTPGGATCELPPVQCGGQNVSLRRGSAPRTLSAGTDNQGPLENGTSLTLQPGVYNICGLSAGRHVTIRVVGSSQSTINVSGEVQLGNGSTLGPDVSTPTPLLNVAGDAVHLGAQDDVRAFITAPSAQLTIGRGTTFTGAACASTLVGSRKVTVKCAPELPATTPPPRSTLPTTPTTTGPSTTTSTSTTTTTTSPLCGNGVLDPGEQCDGSNFGSFTCPSPGGALLCTSDCKIDFSECPSASSTSTTGTVPTTTSTTVTTSTTGTVPPTTSTTAATSTPAPAPPTTPPP